jgi:hypothetical protein
MERLRVRSIQLWLACTLRFVCAVVIAYWFHLSIRK